MLDRLRNLPRAMQKYTPDALGAYFGLPPALFVQRGDGGPIVFRQAGSVHATTYELRGTIFMPRDKRIVRGLPRALPTSDHTPEPYAAHNDRAFIDALGDSEAVVEAKEPGIPVRLYHHRGQFHFATHTAHDGRTPLFGIGVDNVRALGLTVASQAKKLCDSTYPKAYGLAAIGYVPIFTLLLPERETFVPADRPDLVLVDVIDPDHDFVDRLEKERIAEDYNLSVVPLHGRIGNIVNPATYFARIRALELTATQSDGPGFLVKARNAAGHQIVVRAEPTAARAWSQTVSVGDLKAAHETLIDDFEEAILPPAFTEELMLEYLATRRRAVRWQVADWLRAKVG